MKRFVEFPFHNKAPQSQTEKMLKYKIEINVLYTLDS